MRLDRSQKKQVCVALSSTEAEFVALALAVKKAVYLKALLSEIGLCEMKDPITIHNDNWSAQQIATNPTHHAASKHIDIKFHFVRNLINENAVNLIYVSTNNMLADILTKNLVKVKHLKFVTLLGLK